MSHRRPAIRALPRAAPAALPRALPRAVPAAPRAHRDAGRGTASALGLAALLGAAGVTHLCRPDVYDRLIPRRLGPPRPWVLGSGVVELVCAVAVALPSTRRPGALATAALFVAVFPGNVQMALDARVGARSWTRRPVVAWGRLPLQVPLVRWAWRVFTTASAHRRRPEGRTTPVDGARRTSLRR